MHHARMSGVRRRRKVGSAGTTPARSYSQRCAVRVLYIEDRVGGSGEPMGVTLFARVPADGVPGGWVSTGEKSSDRSSQRA